MNSRRPVCLAGQARNTHVMDETRLAQLEKLALNGDRMAVVRVVDALRKQRAVLRRLRETLRISCTNTNRLAAEIDGIEAADLATEEQAGAVDQIALPEFKWVPPGY